MSRPTVLVAGLWLSLTLACNLQPTQAGGEDVQPQTDEQKILYTMGFVLANNLADYDLTPDEAALVRAGLADGMAGREPRVDVATYRGQVQGFGTERVAKKHREAGAAFLAKEAAEQGAVQAESGFVIREIEPGTGESPSAEDTVSVHYQGTLIDGTVFDSSIERGRPASFPLTRVIPCWTEAVQLMKVGGKSRLVCPPGLAYGDRGAPPRIPPGATLVFEVELLEIEE